MPLATPVDTLGTMLVTSVRTPNSVKPKKTTRKPEKLLNLSTLDQLLVLRTLMMLKFLEFLLLPRTLPPILPTTLMDGPIS